MNTSLDPNLLLPEAETILKKHFNLLGVYNIYHYAHALPELYSKLKQIKKDGYRDHDRIIFTLTDIDDHLDEHSPGFILYNLQLILEDLDIPNYFCLILTNRPNYDSCTEYVQKLLTTDNVPIRYITNLLDGNWIVDIATREFDKKQITHSFCALSRVNRTHRSYFMCQLLDRNLQDRGLIAYNNVLDSSLPKAPNIELGATPIEHLSFLPYRLHIPKLLLYKEENQQKFKKFLSTCSSYKNFNESIDIQDKHVMCEFLTDSPILNSLIYVGLETLAMPSKLFISRISLRGVVEQRPFILLAQPGMLKFMQSLGFKTFGEFWDESYDDIIDFESRVDAIIDILELWSKLSVAELQQKAEEMRSIIEYNYNFYTTKFKQEREQYLDEQCYLNLQNG
jgi:hypothetical protein